MGTLQGIIFDIDGTLLASNEAHAHAWVDAFSDFGWDVPFFRLKWLIGMGGDKLLGTVVPTMSESEGIGHILSQQRKRIFLERYAPLLKPTPGAREFVQRLKDEGLKLVIATSSNRQELETLLEKAEVADLLTEATTASDVEASKPAPDVVQSALEKLQLSPENVLMVGDTPYDVESAKKAEVGVVAVRSGGWNDETLSDAVAVYENPADILAHWDESPFAADHR